MEEITRNHSKLPFKNEVGGLQVTVHNGAKLEEGSILSYGVVCGKDFNVAALSRVSLFKQVHCLLIANHKNNIKQTYAGTTDSFTPLRVLSVLTDGGSLGSFPG